MNKIIASFLFVSILLTGCSTATPADPTPAVDSVDTAVLGETPPPAPDYSVATNWLTTPANPTEFPVDIFWVYPTVYTGEPLWQSPDDAATRETAAGTLVKQAAVFTDSANLYAPIYRQANITVLSQTPEKKAAMLAVGESDIRDAFDFYLENYNDGRPVILAGHSQGSNDLTDLMVEDFHSKIADRLVAAYLIGWSVTPDDLAANPKLKICEFEKENGCIVTYNSVADGKQNDAPTILPNSFVVNPLSWTTASGVVPASENIAAVLFNSDGTSETIPAFTSAEIKDNGLVVDPADPDLLTSFPFGEGIFHAYDYSFFFENLKANVGVRVENFLSKNN